MQSQLRSHHIPRAAMSAPTAHRPRARRRSGSLADVLQIYPAVAAPDGEPETGMLARLYEHPAGGPSGRPWVRANMVASADGAATADGRSGGLGGQADRDLFQLLRSLADVILVGAGTARTEGYKPARAAAMTAGLRGGRPATPPIAVVSGSLDLDPESPLLAGAPADARTIVLTSEWAPADRRAAISRHATVLTAGTERVSVSEAVSELAGLGHARILTEGGPVLLAQLTAAGLLDDLCLTVSPILVGGNATRILTGPPGSPPLTHSPQPLRLAHVLADHGFLFCRYLRA